MATLRIAFSGLCTFAFKHELLKGKKDPTFTEATVLLQRLTRARPLVNVVGARTEILDQHFPLLEFNLANWNRASTRNADVHYMPDEKGTMKKGACFLNGEDLTILVDGQPMKGGVEVSTQKPLDPSSAQMTQADQDSLWWMATLDDIFPDKPEINPKLLDTPPGSNQPILARIKLSQGRLRTLALTDSACTIVAPVPTSFNQRVATSFELDLEFKEWVEFKIVANRNGKTAEKCLAFRAPDEGDLQIGIMNMEVDRVMGADPASGPRPESDFAVYADLLEKQVQGIPFLRPTSPGNPAGNSLSTCVPLVKTGTAAAGGTH